VSDLDAVLDADVLITAGPRDTLLRAFEADLYQAYWSADILAEVERNLPRLLVQHGHHDAPARARSLVVRLLTAFPRALVEGYEPLIATMTNDPKDRHVVAAAVAARVGTIVTLNRRHFPAAALQPHGIVVRTPDEFLLALFAQHPVDLCAILRQQGADLRHPRTLDQQLRALRSQLPRLVAAIEARREQGLPCE
jgi:predicted nucleic acid-binding protein